MDLLEVRCGYMDWIGLAQDRDRWWTLVSAEMNLRVPWNAGNFLTSCKPASFSRRTLHHGVSKEVRTKESFLRSYQFLSQSRNSSHFVSQKLHYHTHKSPPFVPILSRMNPTHITQTYSFMRHAFFWDFRWHRMVTIYRRYRATYRSHIERSSRPSPLDPWRWDG